jgi:hypothetical protein
MLGWAFDLMSEAFLPLETVVVWIDKFSLGLYEAV